MTGALKSSTAWGFVGLCVLSGNGWVLVQAWPSAMAWPFAGCIHFALIGCLGLAVAAIRKSLGAASRGRASALIVAGGCLFVLPAAALEFAGGAVSELTSVAIFCAVPVMTILAATTFGLEAEQGTRLRALLAPSLVGLGGALVLFPVEVPGSVRRWLFFTLILGCGVTVALASVWMHELLQRVDSALAVAAVGWGSAAMFGLCGVFVGWPEPGARAIAAEGLRCLLFDLPVVWLTLWLMREVSPARLSARFLLGPLVTAVEGYAVLRGGLDLRTVVAILLVGAGGVMLLVRNEPDEVPGLQLQ